MYEVIRLIIIYVLGKLYTVCTCDLWNSVLLSYFPEIWGGSYNRFSPEMARRAGNSLDTLHETSPWFLSSRLPTNYRDLLTHKFNGG